MVCNEKGKGRKGKKRGKGGKGRKGKKGKQEKRGKKGKGKKEMKRKIRPAVVYKKEVVGSDYANEGEGGKDYYFDITTVHPSEKLKSKVAPNGKTYFYTN